MSIAKKGRRKIVLKSGTFYWCVKAGNDDDRFYLNIVSENKKFIVDYMLGQTDENRGLSQWNKFLSGVSMEPKVENGILSPKQPFIIVKGKEFKGLDNLDGRWNRFLVPEWKDDIITPSIVATIIEWCFTKEPVISVDYEGNIIKLNED